MRNEGKKALKSLLWLILLGGLIAAGGAALADPHHDAATCLAQYAVATMPEPCWQVCTNCHAPLRPIQPLDIYQDGDARICSNCHPRESQASSAGSTFLLVGGGGGTNHPVNVLYLPETSRHALRDSPQGPRLFYDTDGLNPKVQCSTCHNPMGGMPGLLRLGTQRSALCFACHKL